VVVFRLAIGRACRNQRVRRPCAAQAFIEQVFINQALISIISAASRLHRRAAPAVTTATAWRRENAEQALRISLRCFYLNSNDAA
jgi:hypothetical protein